MMARAAWATAASPEAQSRVTVSPATEGGSPAKSAAIRPTFRLSSPAWLAHPRMTSAISPKSSAECRAPSAEIIFLP